MRRSPNLWGLVAITYGLVLGTSILATASYFYYRSEIKPTESADPNPLRRMLVGAVWVPVYEGASYIQPSSVQEKQITTGSIKFSTTDPAAKVLAFFRDHLKEGGLITVSGSTVHAVRHGGKTNVTVTLNPSPTATTGQIHTLVHADPPAAN